MYPVACYGVFGGRPSHMENWEDVPPLEDLGDVFFWKIEGNPPNPPPWKSERIPPLVKEKISMHIPLLEVPTYLYLFILTASTYL